MIGGRMAVAGLILLVSVLASGEAAGCFEGEKHPVSGSCSDYQECVDGVLVKKSCYYLMRYDPQSRSCRMVWNVDCDKICREGEQRAVPDNCQQYDECVDGVVMRKTCSTSMRFDYETHQCRSSLLATCGFSDPGTCKENSKRPVLNSCQDYEQCVGGIMVRKSCWSGTRFDPVKLECRMGWNVDCLCKENATKPVPGNCTAYQECRNGTFLTLSCPQGQMFDSGSSSCKASAVDFCRECHKNGQKVAIPDDCQVYDECVDGFLIRKSCSMGERFDIDKTDCRMKWWAKCAKKVDCQPLERRPVDGSCTDYLECQDGKFVRQTCLLDRYFDPVTLVCLKPAQVNCKGCVEGEKKAVIGDRGSYTECVNGVPVEKGCPEGAVFDIKTKTCHPRDGACTPGQTAAVLTRCEVYYKCEPKTGRMVQAYCPDGAWYEWRSGKCVTYSEGGECNPKNCEDDQVPKTAVTADGCKTYMVCSDGQFVVRPCQGNYLFDDSAGKCLPKSAVICPKN